MSGQHFFPYFDPWVNTVNNMETQTTRTVTLFAQYAQKRNFTKHIFKKHRISCHNFFLLGKRGPTRYLTLPKDHNVSICGLFLILGQWAQIWESARKHPKRVKFQVCFYQSLTDNMAFVKWSHWNLCGFFDFG